MDADVMINDKIIHISCENEIRKGVILAVYAPNLINATPAVQFFLNQLGYRNFWYRNEVTSKAGVFQFEIVEVKEADSYNCN